MGDFVFSSVSVHILNSATYNSEITRLKTKLQEHQAILQRIKDTIRN